MSKYIICFVCGVLVCLIFICFIYNKVTTNPITTSIIVDTIYIERNIAPVSFTAVGNLNATNSPIPIKTDDTGKIIIVDSSIHKSITCDKSITCESTADDYLLLTNAISSLDKYILPEFIVRFDTVISRDTFNLCYEFPRNLFSFDFLPHKDSIMFQQITIEHTKIHTKTNWLTTLLISTSTGIVGYLIGQKKN